MTEPKNFILIAASEARKGMYLHNGGPFGAVIVQDGIIIARAHNQVLKMQDPTAHAEMLAIRKAAKKLRRFDLSDCQIYSSCEPCPMCLAAIHWARIPNLYFGCSQHDAALIGFNDATIYDLISGKTKSIHFSSTQINRETCLYLFAEWQKKTDKQMY